ncbi:hypothetical protein O181_090796 [Austropuccinia psidii MF-1]|uniref:Uncharacterized protein n=1 Tax=Austropuccinia psidii MF-1 TaxID=1389203 RepID=A0A9Q3IW54_9BASI|nr:hypothetical protein [Austropuccinia psidii MF-1]
MPLFFSIDEASDGNETITIFYNYYCYIIWFIITSNLNSTTPTTSPFTSVTAITDLPQADLVQDALSSLPPVSYSPVSSSARLGFWSSFFFGENSTSASAATTNTSTSSINQKLFNQFFEYFDTGFFWNSQDFHPYVQQAQTASVNTPRPLRL